MKFIALMLCGLFSLATAYPYPDGELAKVEHSTDCILLEYHLGYVIKEFRVCRYPTECIDEPVCLPGRQLVQIGAPQFIFLKRDNFFDSFFLLQLFGSSTGFCLRASPPLPTCSSYDYDVDVGGVEQTSDEREVCVTDEDTGEKICTPLGVTRKF